MNFLWKDDEAYAQGYVIYPGYGATTSARAERMRRLDSAVRRSMVDFGVTDRATAKCEYLWMLSGTVEPAFVNHIRRQFSKTK